MKLLLFSFLSRSSFQLLSVVIHTGKKDFISLQDIGSLFPKINTNAPKLIAPTRFA